MYLAGKGVPQSVAKSMGIQCEIVNFVRKRYEESGAAEDLEELYRELRICEDRCWELKDRLGSDVNEMLEICHMLYKDDPASEAIERADCLMRRARAGYWNMIREYEFDEPEADFREAVRLIDHAASLAGETGKTEKDGNAAEYRTALISEKLRVIREMAMMEKYKSEVLSRSSFDPQKIKDVHRRWIECADNLEALIAGPAPVAERMKAYRQLGDIYAYQKMEKEAIHAYEQAAETAVNLLDVNPAIEYRASVKYIYDKLKDYEEKRGNNEKLREYRTKQCAIYTIVSDFDSARNRSLYPLFDRAERAMIHGETDLAKSLYLRCAAGEGINAEPPALWYFENKCLYRLDYFAGFIDNCRQENWEYRCRYLENQERITSLENTRVSRMTLARRYEKMSAYALKIDPQKALEWYRGCFRIWDALYAETGNGRDALNRETARLRLACSGLLPGKESDQMMKLAESALTKIAEENRGAPEESGALTELGRLYRKKADTCCAEITGGNRRPGGLRERAVLGRAAGFYKKSIDCLEKAAQTEDPEPALEELKSLYLALDRNKGMLHRPDSFEKALETQRRLLKLSITKSHLEEMGDLLYQVYVNAENKEEVPAEIYREMLAVYSRLGAGWPETQEEDTSWRRTYISRDMLVQKNEDPYPQYVEWMEESLW